MAWVHSGWIAEETLAGREKELRLHVKEVSDAIGARMQSDGTLIDSETVQEYRKDLMRDLTKVSSGGNRLTRGRVFQL